MAKQYAPYLTISRGSFRCVMPNTTDAKSAKTSAAEKWESVRVNAASRAESR